jgi:DNA repair exonuclease SbcCD nuclease subunit
VRGNHDVSKITRELILLPSMKLFGSRAETTLMEAGGSLEVTVHSVSFMSAHAPESLLLHYKPPVEGAAIVSLLHTSLSSALGHDLRALYSPVDLAASGFNYWAHGHTHKRVASQSECAVVMPSMPHGRDINKRSSKSAMLFTASDDRCVRTYKGNRFTSRRRNVFILLRVILHM